MEEIKSIYKKIDWSYLLVPACILVSLWVLYAFTGQWPNSTNIYNSYVLQADAWLHGHLDLSQGDYYSSYLELAVYHGRYYVSFPPFPSVLLLPFVAVFGKNTPDHFLAILSFLTAGFYSVRLYRKLNAPKQQTVFWVLFSLLACNTIYTSINGWVWFLAQNLAFTFTLMAFYYAKCKKPGLFLTFWAFAIGCRPLQLVYLPLLLFIYWTELKKEHSDSHARWTCLLPMSITAIFYMALNYLRFGNILQFGHDYLPEFTESTYGQFNIHYMWINLKRMLRLPYISGSDGRLNFYYFDGFAFWLISPIFLVLAILVVRNLVRKKNLVFTTLLLATLLVHFIGIIAHKTLGGSHFGNRYMNDLIPAVYYGVISFLPQKDWLHKVATPLFILGITLNFIGVAVGYNLWYGY